MSNEKYNLIKWFQLNAREHKLDDSNFINETDNILNHYFDERKKHYGVLEAQFKGIIVFKVLFTAIVLFFGAYLVQIGELNIGQFVASEIIIFLVINSVEKLVGSLSTCYDIITSLYKVESIFGDHQEYSFVKEEGVELQSVSNIYVRKYSKAIKYLLLAIGISGVIILLMPWTQNVESVSYTHLDVYKRQGLNSLSLLSLLTFLVK